ncbi:hypothetical protein ABBQ32_002072 [Trebouxia sp. C0010 RCD-2024]
MKGHSGLQSYSQAREAQEVQLNRLQQEEQAVEDEQAEQQQPAKRGWLSKCGSRLRAVAKKPGVQAAAAVLAVTAVTLISGRASSRR